MIHVFGRYPFEAGAGMLTEAFARGEGSRKQLRRLVCVVRVSCDAASVEIAHL